MTLGLVFKKIYTLCIWQRELTASPWSAPADVELLYLQLALGIEHG